MASGIVWLNRVVVGPPLLDNHPRSFQRAYDFPIQEFIALLPVETREPPVHLRRAGLDK